MALMLGLGLFLQQQHGKAVDSANALFEYEVNETVESLSDHLETYQTILESLRGVARIVPPVTSGSWKSFFDSFNSREHSPEWLAAGVIGERPFWTRLGSPMPDEFGVTDQLVEEIRSKARCGIAAMGYEIVPKQHPGLMLYVEPVGDGFPDCVALLVDARRLLQDQTIPRIHQILMTARMENAGQPFFETLDGRQTPPRSVIGRFATHRRIQAMGWRWDISFISTKAFDHRTILQGMDGVYLVVSFVVGLLVWGIIALALAAHGRVCSMAKNTASALLAREGQLEDERSRAEYAQRCFQIILRHLPDPVLIRNADYSLRDCNDALCVFLGLPLGSLLAGDHPENYLIDEDAVFLRAEHERVLEQGSSSALREVTLRSGAIKRLLDLHGSRIVLPGADVVIVTITRDVTEDRQRQQALVAARDEAETANRTKSEFLANMSHEIRTPLNSIMGMAQLLEMNIQEPNSLEYCRTILDSSQHLLDIINDILDIAKVESGRMNLENLAFSLRGIVADLVATHRLAVSQKRLEFLISLGADVPDVLVGDVVRLRQIVSNLLSNAIKFTDKGHVLLEVRRLPEMVVGDGRSMFRFAVHDTGIGIPEDKQPLLFEKFVQADSSITRVYGGTGLGLTLVKRLAEMMGGGVEFYSVQDGGSQFAARVPFMVAAVQAADVPEWPLTSPSAARVWVLHAYPFSHEILGDMLSDLGVETRFALSCDSLIDGLGRDSRDGARVDAVLVDDAHGLLNRQTLIQRLIPLFEEGFCPPVVMMVASGDAQATKAEQGPVIVKPVLPTSLCQVLSGLHGQPVQIKSTRKVDDRGVDANESCASAPPQDYVLVVDDDPFSQKIVRQVLHRMNLASVNASNGHEALEAIRCARPSLIVMDINMPHLTGLDVTRQLRSQEAEQRLSPIPILALTAKAMQGDRELCLRAGMNDYLSKPVLLPELQRKIAHLISGKN